MKSHTARRPLPSETKSFTNVKIGNVEIFRVNGAQKREQCGYLVFEEDYQEEISKKAYERVIDYTILGSKTAEIFTAIKDGKFDFQYMCESLLLQAIIHQVGQL